MYRYTPKKNLGASSSGIFKKFELVIHGCGFPKLRHPTTTDSMLIPLKILLSLTAKLFPLGFGWNLKKKLPPVVFLREASPDSPDNKLKVKFS